jgi:hypothetical protein
VDALDRFESELGQRWAGPPRKSNISIALGTVSCRRLRDQEPAASPQQGSGTFRDGGRPAEGASHGSVERSSLAFAPTHHFCSGFQDAGPFLEVEEAEGRPQEGSSPSVGLDEHQPGLWPQGGDDEARETTARAQIEQAGLRYSVLGPEAARDGGKGACVTQLRLEGPRSEEPRPAGVVEDPAQGRESLARVGGGGAVPSLV